MDRLTLPCQNPIASDGGVYKCVVKNEAGEINANLNLNIEGGDEEGEAPKFVEKPRIISERDGKLVIMECKVRANPKPTITWTHEGRQIGESRRVKQTISESNGVYTIRMEVTDPDLDDAGLYKCNVKNSAGESNANLSLNIEIVPVISQRPRVIRHEQQRKIVIECAVKSANKPQVTWVRESAVVKEDSRHQVIVREQRKGEYVIVLEIEEPSEKDKGAYKMKAKNEKGEVISDEILVTVEDKEKQKKQKEEEKEEKSTKVKAAPRIVKGLRSEVSACLLLTSTLTAFHRTVTSMTRSTLCASSSPRKRCR